MQITKLIEALTKAQEESGVKLYTHKDHGNNIGSWHRFPSELGLEQIKFFDSLANHLRKKPIITSEFDLEALYRLYPRKEGKSAGMRKLKYEIKTQADYGQVKQAIQNYSAMLLSSDKQFIKLFSTFSNCWRDYLEAAPQKPKQIDPAAWGKS